jgi:hypothetical protein
MPLGFEVLDGQRTGGNKNQTNVEGGSAVLQQSVRNHHSRHDNDLGAIS